MTFQYLHAFNFPTEDLPVEGKKYYAWFSKKAKQRKNTQWDYNSSTKQRISNIYFNERKEEIEVTHVTRKSKPPLYEDLEYRGIVTTWVRSNYE